MPAGKYEVRVIFRGLFRAVPDLDKNRLAVLLVDGRTPRPAPHDPNVKTEVHEPWLEFAEACWRNPDATARVVTKMNTRLAQLRLDERDVRFSTSAGSLGPSFEVLPEYQKLPQLEQIESGTGATDPALLDPSSTSPASASCLARAFASAGQVTSERESRGPGGPMVWKFTPAAAPGSSPGPDTRMNLDLRVDFEVDLDAEFLIELQSHKSGIASRTVRLAPLADSGPIEVRVWNAEPDLVKTATATDAVPHSRLDLDFLLHYDLSIDQGARRIPMVVPISSDGCCCGGTGGKPGS